MAVLMQPWHRPVESCNACYSHFQRRCVGFKLGLSLAAEPSPSTRRANAKSRRTDWHAEAMSLTFVQGLPPQIVSSQVVSKAQAQAWLMRLPRSGREHAAATILLNKFGQAHTSPIQGEGHGMSTGMLGS